MHYFVLYRLVKELQHYETELATNEAKIAAMKAKIVPNHDDDDDDDDDNHNDQDDDTYQYDIKYQQTIVNESRVMVPDTHRRLGQALEELAQQLQLVLSDDHDDDDDNVDATSNDQDNDNDNNNNLQKWKTTAQILLREHATIFPGHDVLLQTSTTTTTTSPHTDVEGLADGEAF